MDECLMSDVHVQRAAASRKFAAGREKRQEEAAAIHGNCVKSTELHRVAIFSDAESQCQIRRRRLTFDADN
jgi:hypothetical protein